LSVHQLASVCCAMIYGVVTLGDPFCYHSSDVKAIDVSAGLLFTPYLQTYRHDMTYSVLKVPLNPNQPTLLFTPSSGISPEYYHNGSSWFRDTDLVVTLQMESEHMVI